MSDELDMAATKRDVSTLRLELKSEMLELKSEVRALRNSFWLQIAVPSLTLIVSLVIHYIFR
jgi:hypothetical protein